MDARWAPGSVLALDRATAGGLGWAMATALAELTDGLWALKRVSEKERARGQRSEKQLGPESALEMAPGLGPTMVWKLEGGSETAMDGAKDAS